MFEAETRAAILERLKEYHDEFQGAGTSAVEGTFAFDTLAANAKEFEKAYAEMDLMMEAAFPQTSWGGYLDYLADELAGLSRRKATSATAVLTISGTAGAKIPKGSVFSTGSSNFTTNAETVVGSDGVVEVKATASATGAGGNVGAGTIIKIPIPIYGVSQVTNKEAASGGYEEESDDALRERLLFAVRQPATSGNVYHYIEWATAVPGVGAVKVLPLWNGNGTVKVIVVDANKDSPGDELLQAVRDAIAVQAPIGATVTVVGPVLTTVNLALKVTSGIGNAEAIKTVLTKYFKGSVFSTDYTNMAAMADTVTISYAQIGRIILDNADSTGVKDYTGLTINGGTENIVVGADHLPVVGTVTLT